MGKIVVVTAFIVAIFSQAFAPGSPSAFSSQAFAQGSPSAQTSPELGRILETEKSVFGQFHLVPIVIPEGERVGDILDVENATLIAGPDDCFPGLKPRRTTSQLPALTVLSENSLAAALGAGGVAEASGTTQAGQLFTLDFDEVLVERVSKYQLRAAVRKNVPECDTVRPYIDASFAPPKQPVHVAEADHNGVGSKSTVVTEKLPPLLVGMLFSARRIVHVRTTNGMSANAQFSFAEQLLTKFGLNSSFKVMAGGGDNNSRTVDLVGQYSVPVAFAPAFVVTATRQLANGKTGYDVAELDQSALEKKIQVARAREGQSLTRFAKVNRSALVVSGYVESVESRKGPISIERLLNDLDGGALVAMEKPDTPGEPNTPLVELGKPDVLKNAMGVGG